MGIMQKDEERERTMSWQGHENTENAAETEDNFGCYAVKRELT